MRISWRALLTWKLSKFSLAYAEMRLILVRLLWHFDIELLPGSMNWYDQKVFIFWEKPDLDVKLTRVRY